jgi:hypothetical protein
MTRTQAELKSVVTWIAEQTGEMMLPADRRAQMALGCLDLAIEHQAAICLLAEHLLWGPTYALLRCLLDAFVRGVWLARCASEIDLDAYQLAGLRRRSFEELVGEVERALGHSRGVLSKLTRSSWAMFGDLTQSGFEPADRRRNQPVRSFQTYPSGDTEQALRLATALGLLAATEVANLSGNLPVARACQEKAMMAAASR